MRLTHDEQSRICCDELLSKWRSSEPNWTNIFIKNDIHYVGGSLDFPSPDRSFYSDKTQCRIAIEFKPSTESKRGILTGLGQAIAYLNKNNNSASYLICPNKVENFEIGSFMENLFKKKIFEKLPIGLITFDPKNLQKIKIRCNIANSFGIQKTIERNINRNYWAAYRDSYPYATYYLLNISNNLNPLIANRSKVIWDNFYDNYLGINNAKKTLSLVNSKIRKWDGGFQILLESKKRKLQKQIDEGAISIKNALEIVNKDTAKNVTDNNYQDLKKNHFNFINHLKLWDHDSKNLTNLGLTFANRVKEGKNINQEIAKVLLISGKHRELIETIEKFYKNQRKYNKKIYSNENELREDLYKYFDDRGYIKKNPGRSSSGSRKFLTSELQIWFKLGLKTKFKNQTRHFDQKKGYGFDFKKIEKLTSDFYREYPSEVVQTQAILQ